MSLDLSDHVAPKSDQLDAVDLLSGPRVFTIKSVSQGNAEQPFNFHLAEFPRPWRPGLSMRRVLLACWGKDANTFVGRRLELFCDPTVVFGGQPVGGIRISRLSHLAKKQQVPLLVSRGKSAMWTVEPLPDNAPASAPVVADETLAELVATFKRKSPNEATWVEFAGWAVKSHVTSLDALTEDQARTVLAQLAKRPDATQLPASASDEDQCPVCGAHSGQAHDDDAHAAAGA